MIRKTINLIIISYQELSNTVLRYPTDLAFQNGSKNFPMLPLHTVACPHLSTFKKVSKSTLCSTIANCSRTGERKGVPGWGGSKRDTEEGRGSQKGLRCQDPTQQVLQTTARLPCNFRRCPDQDTKNRARQGGDTGHQQGMLRPIGDTEVTSLGVQRT